MAGDEPDDAGRESSGDAEGSALAEAARVVRERAAKQVTEQTRTYPCAQCGGQLEFDIATQTLKCPQCGNAQDIVENQDGAVSEQDLAAAIEAIRSGAVGRDEVQLEGEKEVVCQSCGGHTTFTGSLTATNCPYCATPIQRDDVHDAPSRLAVDGVLPFQVDQKSAHERIDKWISSRWFAPNEFKKYGRAGSFASIYAAYFTYDAQTSTRYQGERGDHYQVTVGSGDNQRTETRTRWSHRSGTVENGFDDVPVLANTGFQDKHVKALEPWPTGDARPYSAEFVAGHLCRTYDNDVEESFGPARRRMENGIRDSVRRDIGGDEQRIHSIQVAWNQLSYKHLLLPIWLLTVIYAQTTYQVFMNGMTGDVHGQRPYSKIKIAMAIVAALVVLAVVLGVLSATKGSGRR